MGKYEQLEKILKLKEVGYLSDEEYKMEKDKILDKGYNYNNKDKKVNFEMVGLTLLIVFGIFLCFIVYCYSKKLKDVKLTNNVSEASNSTEIDFNLLKKYISFHVKINSDKSIDVIETWKYDNLGEYKTLYKTFVIDNNKYKGISNVKVSQVLENDRVIEFEQDDEWKYHLSKETFFAGINNEGNYEIAWGIAENSDKGTYVISYTVNDVVAVYNDCAELYWQFIGNGFALPVDIVVGTIKLPTDLISKEDIKVWGHTTKSLNGEIHVTSLNSVEFQVNKYKPYNYVEVRLAMPTYLFDDDESKINTNKLESIVEEERNWARAN